MQFGGQALQGQHTSEYTKDIEAPVIRLKIPEKADANSEPASSYKLKRQPAMIRPPREKGVIPSLYKIQAENVTATNPASELISER